MRLQKSCLPFRVLRTDIDLKLCGSQFRADGCEAMAWRLGLGAYIKRERGLVVSVRDCIRTQGSQEKVRAFRNLLQTSMRVYMYTTIYMHACLCAYTCLSRHVHFHMYIYNYIHTCWARSSMPARIGIAPRNQDLILHCITSIMF